MALTEKMTQKVAIRKALPSDAPAIVKLVDEFKFEKDGSGSLLPIDEATALALIEKGCFSVAELEGLDEVIGCASVVEYNGNDGKDEIAELRSLAVYEKYWGNGIGTRLVEWCKELASAHEYDQLYALTKPEKTGKFEKWGFVLTKVPVAKLEKDCEICPSYDGKKCYKEIAMITELSNSS